MIIKDIEILKKMFMKCTEFKPSLTPEQYKVYVKHLEFIYHRLIKVHKENKDVDYMIKFKKILGTLNNRKR